jgi:hypothetical protein
VGIAAGPAEIDPADPAAGLVAPVATAGTIFARVDASYEPIRVGDLLAVSPTPGHAMRSPIARPGTIVGKALEELADGAGTIRVLVMSR